MKKMTIALTAVATLCAAACNANADTTDQQASKVVKRKFVRIINDDRKVPLTLQVANAHYQRQDGDKTIEVDLVGAVHIGDQSYYAFLNSEFDQYDAVLYELIAPTGTRVDAAADGEKSMLSRMQLAMTSGLDLAFQLEEVDYNKDVFVHADLTPSEFKQAMQDAGETPIVMAWRLLSTGIREGARAALTQGSTVALRDMLLTGDNATKVMFARELTKTESMQGLLGDDATSSVIGARNARAVEVLVDEISDGDSQLAIFYGVGHLPDLERRLVDELGFEFSGITWLDAWDLQSANDDP